MTDEPAELPAYGRGAERLLRALVARGLRSDALRAGAALAIALDERRRSVDDGVDSSDELLEALDQAGER